MKDYDFTPGAPTDVVVLNTKSPTETIVMHADCRQVVKTAGCLLKPITARTRH